MSLKKEKSYQVFVIAGRLGKSLIRSKVIPFAIHPNVKHVYIFSEEEGFAIERSSYVTIRERLAGIPGRFLKKVIRFILEPLQIMMEARKRSPFVINGIYTLPKGLNALLAAKVCGTKSVISVIGGPVEITTHMRGTWFWKRLNLWMLRTCDAVTTKGSRVTSYLIDHGIPKEKIFNLNGSIDTDRFCLPEIEERNIDILFVGTFRTLKGPDRVLSVVEQLVRQGHQIRAVFLGDGELYSSIDTMIQDKNLQKYATLLGYQDDPVRYFQGSKILMMPSVSEGLPTAMLEAMACGCVPVVSNVGNITDAAIHMENACVIESWSDIDAFSGAASILLTNPDLRRTLSLNGREMVEKNYTPEVQSKVVEKIFSYLT